MELFIDGIVLEESQVIEESGKVKFPIKVIQPGWGSSGYYSKPLLKRFAESFNGAHMYWDHPGKNDRPERSLRDLAATLSDAIYNENGKDGPGVYAIANVFEHFVTPLQEMAEYIGVSIRANGAGKQGKVDGKKGLIIESISNVLSVDFVTKAGAGGKILAQFAEAALTNDVEEIIYESDGEIEKEDELELKEALDAIKVKDEMIETLTKTVEGLTASVARMNEAAMVSNAAEIVESQLEGTDLIDATKIRIKESMSNYLPLTVAKELDVDAIKLKVQEAIKTESEYLKQFVKTGVQMSMGKTKPADINLVDMFKTIGMSESAAKIAANGR